eukprot:CAMPEP_0178603034 /NCGR_PEP_ID=MMETSP0697-20121206/35283_1 /TAXON_ID=265572 /ORGANISM="Extubocellulus spinifer, Strain CCMP396" /LENGTH=112 /DNA_ID=CAMNT_0020241287 /DNA_START=28 /DNA_END=367 /DNA_ORIENTATION=-
MTIVATVGMVRMLFYRKNRRPEAKKLFWIGEMWYTLIPLSSRAVHCRFHAGVGTGSDATRDMALAAGIGAYCLTLSACCCRAETLDISYRLSFAMGALPVITVEDDKGKKAT